VLRRLHPFDCKLHYADRHRLPAEVEKELNLHYHEKVEDMVKICDVVTINCPLHPETEHMFNTKMINLMKRGSYIVNTARGKICDVWFPQPAPQDHPWRTMPWHAMTPHTSGPTLSAQQRYAAGVQEILECHFEGRALRNEYLIAENGKLAGAGAHAYSEGNATGGSEEAAKYSKQ